MSLRLTALAAGLTLVFGIMDCINLAHGSLYMVGAYLVAAAAQAADSFWIGLGAGVAGAALLGLLLELSLFHRLYRRDHLSQVLATFALILIANEAVRLIWGAQPVLLNAPEALAGALQPDSGSVHFAGREVTRLSMHQRVAGQLAHGEQRALELAMALATQPKLLLLDEPMAGTGPEKSARMVELIAHLAHQATILLVEHDLDAVFRLANRRGLRDAWTPARVCELFPPLRERAKNLGNQLSGGEQQMLAIGRALVTNPRLLILDEASEGLAPLVREEIWACLARLRTAGQSLLVVDKYVERLIALADQHTIIERGQVVWRGSSAQLDADHGVWHRYLGIG
jgi:ABC-type branched-subunit amino acid transport system ATPase component